MTWAIIYKTHDGNKFESKHDFTDENAAITQAREMQRHPQYFIILEIITAEGRTIAGKELENLLSKSNST